MTVSVESGQPDDFPAHNLNATGRVVLNRSRMFTPAMMMITRLGSGVGKGSPVICGSTFARMATTIATMFRTWVRLSRIRFGL